MNFSKLAEKSEAAEAAEYTDVIERAIERLGSEDDSFANQTVTGKLVTLQPVGEALIIGDLHGDLESLTAIFQQSDFLTRLSEDKDNSLIFLGDYGDRGVASAEIYYCVLSLKLAFPSQVVLLRGNHEGPSDLMASPHDLPLQLERRFKEKWVSLYAELRELFSKLYNAVYVVDRYLMVHGGLPLKLRSLQEIADADRFHPDKSFLEELLWNDPEQQIEGSFPSPRGAGNLFGRTITQQVLRKINAKILIRGHEPAGDGFKINHDGKVLTLFSRKGPPYFNTYGAYLQLPLAENFKTANHFIRYIHKF